MSLVDAYTAGLFDGEGTVTLCKKQAREFRAPIVQLASTSLELLEFLKGEYGGYISKTTKREEHHKQAWIWSCIYVKAINFFKRIYPYIKEAAKRERIRLLIEVYPQITRRNGKYTADEKKVKLAFERTFFGESKSWRK